MAEIFTRERCKQKQAPPLRAAQKTDKKFRTKATQNLLYFFFLFQKALILAIKVHFSKLEVCSILANKCVLEFVLF